MRRLIRSLSSSENSENRVYLLWQKNSDRFDAILANLALEEGEEELPQVVDSIPLDPEMPSEMA